MGVWTIIDNHWTGIALGLSILAAVVFAPRWLLIYLRLIIIALPMLVIGGGVITWVLGKDLNTDVLRTLIPAIVVVLGWFITFIFQEDRRSSERRGDRRDLQVALCAEIQTYIDTFDAYDLDLLRQQLRRDIDARGEAYMPFLTVEREPVIFLKLSTDLHRLPADQVNVAVVFYTRLLDMRTFAQELNSPEFRALPIERRQVAYFDYYDVRDYVAQSAQIALKLLSDQKTKSATSNGPVAHDSAGSA